METPRTRPPSFAPLETTPPNMGPAEAEAIALRLYRIIGGATPMDSERDLNWRIDTEDGRRFVLKLSNPADDPAVLDLQNRAMLHILRQDPSLPVMQPLSSVEARYTERVRGSRGEECLARLFSFLPGEIFESAALNRDAQHAFGATVARMGCALQGFWHPAGGYQILWDIKHTGDLRVVTGDIEDASGRARIEELLDDFDARVNPRLEQLRAQIVHNDLTLDNVLLDGSHQVSGVVDFGDLTHTALICDLAVALVSIMWGRDDPLEGAECTIGGYLSIAAIEEDEAELLIDLVKARLAALVTIAAWRVRRYPENAAYITANVELAWQLLDRLLEEDEGARERLAAACLGDAK